MKEIPLTQGKVALVDDDDYEELTKYKWCARARCRTSYATGSVKNKKYLMHRLIMNAPDKIEIDHIDGNGLNNQKSNLRLATRRLNGQNRHGIKKTSRFVGVRLVPGCKKGWRSEIRIHGKLKSLGYYSTEEEAHDAYLKEIVSLNDLYPNIMLGV